MKFSRKEGATVSFSQSIKLRFLASHGKSRCCRRAFLAGLLASAATLSDGKAGITTTDRTLAEAYRALFAEQTRSEPLPLVRTGRLTLRAETDDRGLVGYLTSIELDPEAHLFVPRCKDCATAFARGVFVGVGRVSDPAASYHLEFCIDVRPERLSAYFASVGLALAETKRRGERLLYTKSSTVMEDYFGRLGENEALFSMANTLIEREIRNGANRVANCEANNIRKAVNAAGAQLEAIEYLVGAELIGSLSPELAETARLRLAHRDLSLTQLAAVAVPAISKPGLSHRLKRLVEIASEHRKKESEEREGKV
jgi:DNA-binding transcriptional regulator WhiA